MRKPDRVETSEVNGIVLNTSIWTDPTEFPWDGDCDLPEGSEGWDIFVRVVVLTSEGAFIGEDSLCSNWATPTPEGRKFVEETIQEIAENARHALWDEIGKTARGAGVEQAKRRMAVAQSLSDSLKTVGGA